MLIRAWRYKGPLARNRPPSVSRRHRTTDADGDRPGGMGTVSPPVDLGPYAPPGGPFRGRGCFRVEAQERARR